MKRDIHIIYYMSFMHMQYVYYIFEQEMHLALPGSEKSTFLVSIFLEH